MFGTLSKLANEMKRVSIKYVFAGLAFIVSAVIVVRVIDIFLDASREACSASLQSRIATVLKTNRIQPRVQLSESWKSLSPTEKEEVFREVGEKSDCALFANLRSGIGENGEPLDVQVRIENGNVVVKLGL